MIPDKKTITLWLVTIGAIVGSVYVWNTADWQAFKDKQDKKVEINYCVDCMTYKEFVEVIEILNEEAMKKQQLVDIKNAKDIVDQLIADRELTDKEKILIEKLKK